VSTQNDAGQPQRVVFVIEPIYDSGATGDTALVDANPAERAYFVGLLDLGEE